ncbi:hypothetical protein HDK77DRAFT_177585 [Phyllosticta capitalensis]
MRCWMLGAGGSEAGGRFTFGGLQSLFAASRLTLLCSSPQGPRSCESATCELLQPVGAAAAAHPPATCPFSRPAYPGHQRLHRDLCPMVPIAPWMRPAKQCKRRCQKLQYRRTNGAPPSHTSSTPPATPSPPPSRRHRHTASDCFSSIPSLSTWFCCAVQPPSDLLRDRKLCQSHRDTPLAVPSAALLLLLHRHPFQAPVAMLPTTVLPSRGHGGNLQPCDLPRTSSPPPCCQLSPTC